MEIDEASRTLPLMSAMVFTCSLSARVNMTPAKWDVSSPTTRFRSVATVSVLNSASRQEANEGFTKRKSTVPFSTALNTLFWVSGTNWKTKGGENKFRLRAQRDAADQNGCRGIVVQLFSDHAAHNREEKRMTGAPITVSGTHAGRSVSGRKQVRRRPVPADA
eukprot:268760-Rhodomonas_salina.1